MPEWLIILIVFFVMSRIVRKSGYGTQCTSGRSHRLRASERHALEREKRRSMPAPKVETPMEALQRRYVEGSITVEEYEAELDKIYRHS